MGGEPLLNPQINEYVKIARKYFPKTDIKITTNAALLDDMDETFWETLNKNKTYIIPSVYPPDLNWESIFNKAKKYNVEIYGDKGYKQKLDINNVNSFRSLSSFKMTLHEKRYNTPRMLSCKKGFKCNNMYDGKIYPCSTVAFIKHLNKKFGVNFEVTKDDYLDLHKIKSINEVKEFMEKSSIPFCSYCGKNIPNLKWEESSEHDISEWT